MGYFRGVFLGTLAKKIGWTILLVSILIIVLSSWVFLSIRLQAQLSEMNDKVDELDR